MSDEQVQALVSEFLRCLPQGWRESSPPGFPAQSELAVLSSVFTVEVPAPDRHRVISDYMRARQGSMMDNLQEVVHIGSDALKVLISPPWGASYSREARRLRVDIVRDMSFILAQRQITSAAEYRAAAEANILVLEQSLLNIIGVTPTVVGALHVNMHADHIPDAVVRSFVDKALGWPSRELKREEVQALLAAVALKFDVAPRDLNHAIWGLQSTSRLVTRTAP